MIRIDPKSIYSIAKKEFMDNIRNKWIIALTIIFVILTIATSYLAGGQAGGEEVFGGMEETVVILLSISTILIPIIAIMLGYATIAGEAESGALSIVLTYPIKRLEVLLGKLFGLGSVLIFSIVTGFGAGGLVIAATVGAAEGMSYLAFIGLTIMLGFMYLSLILCFSALCKKRVTSIAAGVGLFFWSMIFGVIFMGILMAAGINYFDIMMGSGTAIIPDWAWSLVVFSPSDMNQMSIMLAFGIKEAMGIPVEAPDFMSLGFLVFVQLIWITVPMLLAYRFFEKRDI